MRKKFFSYVAGSAACAALILLSGCQQTTDQLSNITHYVEEKIAEGKGTEVKSTEQEVKSVEPAVKSTDPGTKSAERSLETEDEPEPVVFADEEPSKKRFFRFNKQEEEHFSRDKWILSRIPSEDLMDYLRLEQSRMDKLQMAKERKWKRINTTIRLVASLAAGVVAIYFLKDEPTILVNILYICGILGGAWIWNSRKDKK